MDNLCTRCAWSVVEQQLQNHAGDNCHENVITASLDPVVSPRRRTQVVAAPIIDHILPVPVFGRQAVAPSPAAVRASRLPIRSSIFIAISAAPVTTLVALVTAFHLPVAATVIAISIVLGDGEPSGRQSHCHDPRNDYFALHSGPH